MDGIPFWLYIVGFPLLLGPLVTLHELGHYLVGRWFGVHAEAFSVGFGKELIGRTDRRGTRWKLSALPLGGYVQFKGDMNPASVGTGTADGSRAPDGSFQNASLWQRALIVAAGPVVNILVAIGIFVAFFALFGQPVAADPRNTTVISSFADTSPARAAGLAEGDRILAIDGQRVADFEAVRDRVLMYPGRKIIIAVERDGRQMTVPVTIAETVVEDRFGNSSRIGQLGVYAGQMTYAPVGVFEAFPLAVRHTLRIADMMVTGIVQLFTGERSVEELGGPVTIGKFAGEQLSLGPIAFIQFAALISLNLAFINLLPIPALDGGHLAFYAAEAIRRRPLGARGTEMAYRAGVALVLALMLFVTIIDLAKLPIFGS